MKKYPYGFANYPKKFKGCVISPAKICLQYLDVDIKLRPLEQSLEGLSKSPEGGVYVPITQSGNNIDTLAVGNYMHVLEVMQRELIEAYKTYYEKYSEEYRIAYDKDFRDYLTEIHVRLGEILTTISVD